MSSESRLNCGIGGDSGISIVSTTARPACEIAESTATGLRKCVLWSCSAISRVTAPMGPKIRLEIGGELFNHSLRRLPSFHSLFDPEFRIIELVTGAVQLDTRFLEKLVRSPAHLADLTSRTQPAASLVPECPHRCKVGLKALDGWIPAKPRDCIALS